MQEASTIELHNMVSTGRLFLDLIFHHFFAKRLASFLSSRGDSNFIANRHAATCGSPYCSILFYFFVTQCASWSILLYSIITEDRLNAVFIELYWKKQRHRNNVMKKNFIGRLF